jgi:hypothetical protein
MFFVSRLDPFRQLGEPSSALYLIRPFFYQNAAKMFVYHCFDRIVINGPEALK